MAHRGGPRRRLDRRLGGHRLGRLAPHGPSRALTHCRISRRFIPARAGNTARELAYTGKLIGSSPLARGTLSTLAKPTIPLRFIPARAGNTGWTSRRSSTTAVHPRSRGEHLSIGTGATCAPGSSPLARGTLDAALRHRPGRRFIPARAGNTRQGGPRFSASTVHPRSRGEHWLDLQALVDDCGSSPLARGTPAASIPSSRPHRFIPARAGNTSTAWRASGRPTVHPRSRGEHTLRTQVSSSGAGSSPLARGTPRAEILVGICRRFIPARAGNTGTPCARRARGAVHPRSRGEHLGAQDFAALSSGSSPLARGTPRRGSACPAPQRFIPARAGNTLNGIHAHHLLPVHPRSRGEHCPPSFSPRGPGGSSPLARGTRPEGAIGSIPARFIPARAGNTRWPRRRCSCCSVHPRSRGEHPEKATRGVPGYGSSPLARGTLQRADGHGVRERFIPARAGNTAGEPLLTTLPSVHPRSRGEHLIAVGSDDPPLRFIPARAGNTRLLIPPRSTRTVHPRSRGEHFARIRDRRACHGSSPLARGTPRIGGSAGR